MAVDYKLVILDLDGTILLPGGRITARVRQTIRRIIRQNISVTIATGRVFSVTKKISQQLGITAPLICAQGAVIQDPTTNRQLLQRLLPLTDVYTLLDFAEQNDLHLNVYQDEYTYTSRRSADLELYESFGQGEIRIVGNLRNFLKRGVTKALFVCRKETQSQIEQALRQVVPEHLSVSRTHHYFVEVVLAEVSKGSAMLFLCDYLRILPEQVLAIGDHENDLDLIKLAGTGVAMGNADNKIMRHADWIAPSIEEDGAAIALEKFVLKLIT